MGDNPIDDIETGKAFGDLGSLGLTTYRGARAAGATHAEAFTVLAALFAGMFKGSVNDPDPNEDEDDDDDDDA